MKIIKLGLLLLVVIAGLNVSPIASADECERDRYAEFDYQTMLASVMSQGCFLRQPYIAVFADQVEKVLAEGDSGKLSQALNDVRAHLEQHFMRPSNSLAQPAALIDKAVQLLQQRMIANPDDPFDNVMTEWKFDDFTTPPAALDGFDTQAILVDSACDLVAQRLCDTEFDLAANLIGTIKLIGKVASAYTADYRGQVLADREIRRSNWDSYYDDLTFQYPWELWVNNWVLEAGDTRGTFDGNKAGFRPLPKSKLIALHPEVNLVYVKDAANEFETSLGFELIGFERFAFKPTGGIESSWGISLLAAYIESPDRVESSWTAGMLFKLDGYSLGVTDNHGEMGIVLNVNLSQRLFDVKQESRRYYDEYEDKYRQLRQTLEADF